MTDEREPQDELKRTAEQTPEETPAPATEEQPVPGPEETAETAGEEEERKVSLLTAPKRILEALIFAADQPVPIARLSQIMGKRIDARTIRRMIGELNDEYTANGRAFEILEIAGGFQHFTRPDYKRWVAELHRHRRQEKLTPAAIETLAIVAYRQPVLRAKIDDIRGVQSGPMLRSLMERGLIKVVGFQNVPGHPKLYGTTRRFLDHFGLKSLKELPQSEDLSASKEGD